MANKSAIQLQKNIKDNSQELQDFLVGLKDWEKEMKDMEEKLTEKVGEDSESQADIPPVRCKQKIEDSPVKTTSSSCQSDGKRRMKDKKNVKKKEKISTCDYAAWDKFDAEKALESSEEESKGGEQSGGGKRPSATMKERATALKDEGNKLYGSGKLKEAVATYTRGMALDPTNPLLPANRAMAYIKLAKYAAAEADCSKCLELDPTYVKGYLRRATARVGVGKREEAVKDWLQVLELEPGNKEARQELDKSKTSQAKKNYPTNNKDPRKNSSNGTEKQKSTSQKPADVTETNVASSAKDGPEKQENDSKNMKKDKKNDKNSSSVNVNDDKRRMVKDERKEESCRADEGKERGGGKKLKIVEVNSGEGSGATASDPTAVTPIDKPPHLRSTKPLKRIPVVDVATKDMVKAGAVQPEGAIRKNNKPTANKACDSSLLAETQEQIKSSASQAPPTVPKTSHQFTQDWRRVSSQSVQAVQEYLKLIPPSFLSCADLEDDVFSGLLGALKAPEVLPAMAAQLLTALSQSTGFSVNVMFLDAAQKQDLNELISKCEKEEKYKAAMSGVRASLD